MATTTLTHRLMVSVTYVLWTGLLTLSCSIEDGCRDMTPIKHQKPIEDPMLTEQLPKWVDACNKEQMASDIILSFIISKTEPLFSPRLLELERQERGKFFQASLMRKQALEASKSNSSDTQKLTRSRRSIKEQSLQQKVVLVKDDKEGIIFKGYNKSNCLSSKFSCIISSNYKKTSFASATRTRQLKSKNRFFQLPLTNIQNEPVTETPTPSTTPAKPASYREVGQLMGDLHVAEVRITSLVNNALTDAYQVRQIALGMTNYLSGQRNQTLESNSSSSLDRVREELNEWLPNFVDLTRENVVERKQRIPSLLKNMSQYMEFFEVAFEQMLFEQANKSNMLSAYVGEDVDRDGAYRDDLKSLQTGQGNISKILTDLHQDLITLSLRMQCDVENMLAQYAKMGDIKSRLIKLPTSRRIPDFRRLSLGPSKEAADRLRFYSKMVLESPWTAKTKLLKGHLSREVMPAKQRKLANKWERNARDEHILVQMEKLVSLFESLLTSMWI